jgi:hypothetical protein
MPVAVVVEGVKSFVLGFALVRAILQHVRIAAAPFGRMIEVRSAALRSFYNFFYNLITDVVDIFTKSPATSINAFGFLWLTGGLLLWLGLVILTNTFMFSVVAIAALQIITTVMVMNGLWPFETGTQWIQYLQIAIRGVGRPPDSRDSNQMQEANLVCASGNCVS